MEQNMKSLRLTASIVFALFLSLLVSGYFAVPVEAAENQCFSCHTNPRKLIQITREIEAARKVKPAKSAETEGEG
jgi:hypothetical protein